MAKAKVSLEMTTIGYTALQSYLKWSAGELKTEDFQSVLTSQGYSLDVTDHKAVVLLCKNLLTEID